MQTRLTLRLDDSLIAKAKAWARSRDMSLSEAVASFFTQLPDGDTRLDVSGLSSWTRYLVGAAHEVAA